MMDIECLARAGLHHVRSMLFAMLLLCAVSGYTDAASFPGEAMDATELSDMTAISLLSIASCICLVLAVVGCASCCRTGFAKFEETTTETTVVGQSYTSFADFSPPTMSTPSRPPGTASGEAETVTIEPLPQLPGRTSNQWVNVLRVSGSGGMDPGQTMQSIKLIDSPRFQFPRSQISYVDEMGNGWFGKVLQGEAQRMHPGLRKTRVIVKQLRDTATPEEQLLFLQEVQPYREVNHPNVLLLLGQCIDSMPLLLILEYAPFGDLKSYLRKHRSETQEMAQQDIQLKMAADMVSGLMWLHQADFIYIDLATRNCQVSADTSVKIGDYGLALEKYPDDYYITKDNSQAIPIRWLGPEVIDLSEDGRVKTKKITKESNVWSFGIMMLELSTGARRPYAKLTDIEVLQQVVRDQEIRVDKPNLNIHYASRWFEIMMYCWLEADIRPTMKELHDLIMYLKNNRDRIDMPDFETHWNNIKPAALQESSDSSKDEEGAPLPAETNPGPGFQDDFVQALVTEKKLPTTETEPPGVQHLDSKPGAFDSDFGAVPVESAVKAAALAADAPSPNRNMNAMTSGRDGQPIFEDDFLTAVIQPPVESPPRLAQSVPGMEGGIELTDSKMKTSSLAVDLTPPTASVIQASPDSLDKHQLPEDKSAVATVNVSAVHRTSTPVMPVAGEGFETSSSGLSSLTLPTEEGPHSFISTASLSLNRTPSPTEVSFSFHSAISPDSDDRTQFLSVNTVNTTPSTQYQTPDGKGHAEPSPENDTLGNVTSEEPTFVIVSDTAPIEAKLSNPLFTQFDHSPTEFTGFVTAEMPSAVEEPVVAFPSGDATPLGFQMDSGVETNGSMVVEPPGEETIGQSGFLDFTDFSLTTPQQSSLEASLLPTSTTLEAVNSPHTITMSLQGPDDQSQEVGLSDATSVNRIVTSSSSSSSSSSSTHVVKTVRTVRQVRIVGGEEVVTVGEVMTTPEGDGVVSVVPGSDGDGTVIRTLSGGELQMSSSSQQMSSFQSSQQTSSSSSSTMQEMSSDGQLASFTISPGEETVSSNGTRSTIQQMQTLSLSSTTSVKTSSQRVASFQTSGEAMGVSQQISGDGSSSSTMRQLSSSSNQVVSTSQQLSSGSMSTTLQQLTAAGGTGGAEMTFAITGGDDDAAALQQFGSGGMATFGQSSQSLTRSEESSEEISSSSSELGGEGQANVTVSRSMSSSKTQQQSSSVQLMTQTSGDAQLPATFDLTTLGLGAPNGGSLAEGQPGIDVERTMTVSTGPGQMTIGQAMTMQGGGAATGEMENGAQVSFQWQGSAAMKQEHSVFSSEVTPFDGAGTLTEGLAGQSNQLAITSPDEGSSDTN